MRALVPLCLFLIAIPAASADEAPRRKSGQWEVSMSSPQMPAPMVSRQCVDQKTDDLSRRTSQGREKCSKQSVRREGASVVIESVCQVEGSTATTRGVFSGDFASSYQGDMVTRFAPPLHGMSESKMRFQARYLGPCAPGQKPGDVSMQGGPGGGRQGAMSADEARRMAEEMRRQYQK